MHAGNVKINMRESYHINELNHVTSIISCHINLLIVAGKLLITNYNQADYTYNYRDTTTRQYGHLDCASFRQYDNCTVNINFKKE